MSGTVPAEYSRSIRKGVLASLYVVVWVALWHASTVLNWVVGVDLWFPPAGLTFAVLLEYGVCVLPLPISAALLAGLSLWSWEQWPYDLLSALIPPLGYAVAAHVLRSSLKRGSGGGYHFNDPQRVALFLVAAAIGALFSALIGAQVLYMAGMLPSRASLSSAMLGWWIGDFVGVAIFTPLSLIFAAPLARQFGRKERPRLPVSWRAVDPPSARLVLAQGVVGIIVLIGLFWGPCCLWQDQSYSFMTLLLLPILIWTVATHDIRGTLVVLLLYELGIVAMVALFGQANLLFQYQIVMVAVVASGLLTGAISQARLADIARFRDLAEVSNDLLWEFDAHGRLCRLSGQLAQSASKEERRLRVRWNEYVLPQEQGTDLATLRVLTEQRRPFQQIILRAYLPGRKQSVWTCNSGLPLFDEDGKFLGYRGTTTDITAHKKAEVLLRNYDQTLEAKVAERTRALTEFSKRNWQLANFDSLTTLPNRNLFFEHLRKGLQRARRQQRLLALFLVDLDGFKAVNDTFGHDQGDQLLRQIAERLRHCVRAADTVARLGGDEFTVILSDLEQVESVIAVAQKIITRLAEPVPLGDASARVTASIGIALYRPESPDNFEWAMTLLKQADQAMYAAKRAGKNAWRFAEVEEGSDPS
ncbi:MAG: diguanylate cyclase [Phycisphaerales bacterium]|nr:diguanylate cyclase [Phycisphaerales bacterium]